ncbi:hypothetical protein [Aliagarivorans marinus]|uniref:hypothetical protein n=1 Tax=Aliagarivorans marinus TaxID=561965 RepID=UPI00047B1EC8|nr:hypothetical protein [Aliagarivorans marinus]
MLVFQSLFIFMFFLGVLSAGLHVALLIAVKSRLKKNKHFNHWKALRLDEFRGPDYSKVADQFMEFVHDRGRVGKLEDTRLSKLAYACSKTFYSSLFLIVAVLVLIPFVISELDAS